MCLGLKVNFLFFSSCQLKSACNGLIRINGLFDLAPVLNGKQSLIINILVILVLSRLSLYYLRLYGTQKHTSTTTNPNAQMHNTFQSQTKYHMTAMRQPFCFSTKTFSLEETCSHYVECNPRSVTSSYDMASGGYLIY